MINKQITDNLLIGISFLFIHFALTFIVLKLVYILCSKILKRLSIL